MPFRIGHRGAAGTHPENTMASFRRAKELGCHGVEFDVHRTRDGHLVVIHDETLDRTTTGKGLVMTQTLEEVRKVDAGSWKGAQFAGERVPTLSELIADTPDDFLLFLELKAGSLYYPNIEEDVVRTIRESGAAARFQVSSFDHHALQKLHQLMPELPLGMLFADNPLDPVGMAKAIGASALHPAWQWVTPHMVQSAHAAGLQVNAWTCNQPEAIARMKQFGVDGIMSDYPDRV